MIHFFREPRICVGNTDKLTDMIITSLVLREFSFSVCFYLVIVLWQIVTIPIHRIEAVKATKEANYGKQSLQREDKLETKSVPTRLASVVGIVGQNLLSMGSPIQPFNN